MNINRYIYFIFLIILGAIFVLFYHKYFIMRNSITILVCLLFAQAISSQNNSGINDTNTGHRSASSRLKNTVVFATSNLPLLLINTHGKSIPDEPKITALMKVINNPDKVNHINDKTYEYDGYIGIEKRGNTAQIFFRTKKREGWV